MKTDRILLGLVASLILTATAISQASVGTNADLAIGKTASLSSVNVGGVLSFQLTVTNLGPAIVASAYQGSTAVTNVTMPINPGSTNVFFRLVYP